MEKNHMKRIETKPGRIHGRTHRNIRRERPGKFKKYYKKNLKEEVKKPF
jgi:hypothetical protein